MALLEIREVTLRFDDFTAVDDVSLMIQAGEFFTLLGPSGCGKTTLLRLIAGFERPDTGQILLDGIDLVDMLPERRPIRTVFQSYALFPHMTVAGNIAFPLKMAKTPAAQIQAKVDAALEDVRLTGFASRYPHELSGGQRQRVAVARALVTHPQLLLLDEPLSALDAKLREQMQIELINLQKELGITFVYVTHDQGEALALSQRIAIMNEGRIEQLDPPDRLYSYPNNRFVADFIGTCNLFNGRITRINGDVMAIEVAGLGLIQTRTTTGAEAGRSGTLALRPEKVRISVRVGSASDASHDAGHAENHFEGRVKELLYHGDVTVYVVQTDSGARVEALRANSEAGRTKRFEVGDGIAVAWHYDAGHFLYE